MTHCGWNLVVLEVPLLTCMASISGAILQREACGLGIKVGSEKCNVKGCEILSPIIGS